MDVILTHEQADFDALASLLGASFLQEQAIPVLPYRMNRNVRSFLNLYGSEFSFIEARDLPPGNIQTVTLVDTQSLVTLKGIHRKTQIYIYDHHTRRTDLAEDWRFHYEALGACTTLLVERLRDQKTSLGVIQASLLLLGIYEDTGSLLYTSTTPRDVLATAYLLEHGASLRIAAKFLNPPLSSEQKEVYDRLLSSARSYPIHGQNVVITSTSAEGMVEEISSIAHKLRDYLDPDALFLLVMTNEGIRLVARSTTDSINVAKIAALFDGGGHERAAGALLRVESGADKNARLQAVYQQLLEILPGHIRPAITVRQIMSRRPLLLKPETTLKEAAELMQRYGYEGYPVIKDEKIVGLLTRRAVDRALSHKLNLNTESLMDAGEITVSADDSLEHLQRIMAATGWGQVPVLHSKTGAVIGIVTRTDLLKSLGTAPAHIPGEPNLSSLLQKALPPVRLAFLRLVAAAASEQNMPVYIVGGFVRDLLLNRPSLDFDIVVEGDAIHLAHHLSRTYGGRVVSHSRFGTAKWQIESIRENLYQQLRQPSDTSHDLPESLDLITARTEFYDYPTALPTVEHSSIKLDLHRRDFTINTLALRLDGHHYGRLYDYWGGAHDLKNRSVRVLHSLSFVDDPTRMLRAVRFEQRFQFKIENRTLQLISEARPLVKQVSGDRLRHELDLVFTEPYPAETLQRLHDLGLLKAIHPALVWVPARANLIMDMLNTEPETGWNLPPSLGSTPLRRALAYLVWLIPFGPRELDEIGERLRFSTPLRNAMLDGNHLWREHRALDSLPVSAIVRKLDDISKLALYAVYQLNDNPDLENILHAYMTTWQHVQPHTNGETLRNLNIPPGPLYRTILETLRNGWLDQLISTPEEEKQILHQLLANPPERL